MIPPKYSQILSIVPAPTAREIPVRATSARRARPEDISPERKSLMEFTKATPGTKRTIAPMTMVLYEAFGIMQANMRANNVAIAIQHILQIKKLTL